MQKQPAERNESATVVALITGVVRARQCAGSACLPGGTRLALDARINPGETG